MKKAILVILIALTLFPVIADEKLPKEAKDLDLNYEVVGDGWVGWTTSALESYSSEGFTGETSNPDFGPSGATYYASVMTNEVVTVKFDVWATCMTASGVSDTIPLVLTYAPSGTTGKGDFFGPSANDSITFTGGEKPTGLANTASGYFQLTESGEGSGRGARVMSAPFSIKMDETSLTAASAKIYTGNVYMQVTSE